MSDVLTAEETPVFVPSDGESLLALFGSPATAPRGSCVYLVPGGDYFRTVGSAPFPVQVCRTANALGYHSLRYDFHGVGDSTGTAPRLELNDPFANDLASMAAWVEGRGVRRKVLLGHCFGARAALVHAERDASVDALVLISPPLYDGSTRLATRLGFGTVLRRAMRPDAIRAALTDPHRRAAYRGVLRAKRRAVARRVRRLWAGGGVDDPGHRWVSRDVLRPIEDLARREVPMLIFYGTDDDEYEDFLEARSGRLGELLDTARPPVEVVVLPGWLHGLNKVAHHDEITERTFDWLARLPASSREG